MPMLANIQWILSEFAISTGILLYPTLSLLEILYNIRINQLQ